MVSRHPGNPYWHEPGDVPVELSEQQWADAKSRGYLTPEHVLLRLENILEFALGEGASAGLNEHGFRTSLVADGYLVRQGVKLRMWPRDHPPPHVHIELRAQPRMKLRMSLLTGDLLDPAPPGVKRQLSEARKFISEERAMLLERWAEMQAAELPGG